MRLRLPVRAVAVLAALWCFPAPAHETDQYTLPLGRQFADLGPLLSRMVHGAVVAGVSDANSQIEQSLRNGLPTRATAHLQSPELVAAKVWGRLFATFPTNEILDGVLAGQRTRSQYPGQVTSYRAEQSIHDDPLLLLDVTKMVRSLFRACTVSIDGKPVGTDKLIHFIHLGHIYYASYIDARKRGVGESMAVDRAVRLSTESNLLLSENWLLGTLTTGIRSNADLAANYAGFKFYRNLTEPVRLGNRTVEPMLVRQGLYWRLNAQTQPDSDFFTVFVTPHWNEALNPNVYAFGIRGRMRSVLRSRCPDVLDWYRDEHGRGLTRRQFAEIEAELSTFHGEEYGYRSGGEDAVSIASTCFNDGASSMPAVDSMDRGAGTLRRQSPVERPSGWGGQDGTPGPADRSSQPGVDELGRTPLWWAARDGRLDEVERRLAQGEDPNAADADGEGPLHAAARFGRTGVVEALLARGADPGMRALHETTALQLSAVEAQLETARALLKHGADPNARDALGGSPLHAAVARGNLELVVLLLEAGADSRAADGGGVTPLELAARTRNRPLVETLKSSGATRTATGTLPGAPHAQAHKQLRPAMSPPLSHAGHSEHALSETAARQ
jgi:hypothetical protein